METPRNPVAQHQRRAIDLMLDALGVQHARDEAHRAVRRLELGRRAPAPLQEHRRRLHQRLAELTDELTAVEAELDAVDREIDNRIDAERERRLEDI